MKNNLIELDKINIEVIDGDRGKNYPHQDELLEKGSCVFLSANNVTSDGFKFDNVVYITKEKDSILRNGKLNRGDIVITTRGTVGNVAYYSETIPYTDMRINSGMLIVRCYEGVDSKYLYYVLRGSIFQRQIEMMRTGTAQPQLPKSHFLRMKVNLPDLDVQKKIADILGKIDSKITVNKQINENLLQQSQALYRKMFVDTQNELRRVCRAEEYFDITIGKTPPRKEHQWFTTNPTDVTWVSISDMGNCGTYISKSSEQLTAEAVDKFNIKIVPNNTVLLSFKLTVGRIAITHGEMTTNEAIAHFRTDKPFINEYLYCYLKNYNYQTMGSTSSIATAVNSKIIKAMPFVVPTDEELSKFHSIVGPMFKMILNNELEIESLSKTRDTLLPQLMSGELDVSNIAL